MIRRKAKSAWGKISFWLTAAFLVGLVIWININRFNHNIYANYEKVVDYGRVREKTIPINQVAAVIFYAGKTEQSKNISSYLDHAAYYRKKNVKMLMVPRFLNDETIKIVENLYQKIAQYNQIKHIAVVYDKNAHQQKHRAILQNMLPGAEIETFELQSALLEIEHQIEEYFETDNGLVVILNDIEPHRTDFLVDEALYWAQKYHYNLSVIDMIDTQFMQAAETEDTSLYTLSTDEEQPLLIKQKYNLEQYEKRYGMLLWHWFLLNLNRAEQNLPPMWPLKSDETYRLYDRATLYAKAANFEKVVDNEGVVVALVRMAQRFVHKNIAYGNAKLYLLTDKEKFVPSKADLDDDDGIYLTYKHHKAVVLPAEKSADWHDTIKLLRVKAGISDNTKENEFNYYKFKIVEITDEN